jgi:acyl-coenzyme A synthetase/AMP-(fatty) acid ligase
VRAVIGITRWLTFLSTRDLRQVDRSIKPVRFAGCGRPTLNQRVETMDDEGRLVPNRHKGEIVARGSLVFAGYYKNSNATAGSNVYSAELNRWFSATPRFRTAQ